MAKRTRSPMPDQLPPWGDLVEPHAAEIMSPVIASEWRPALVDPEERRRAWDRWWRAIMDLLGAGLWPRFSGGTWAGGAQARMRELMGDDFVILPDLQRQLSRPVESPDPDGSVGPANRTLFRIEDEGGFGQSFRVYSSALAAAVEAVAPSPGTDWINMRILAKCGSIDLLLKDQLQRPRAYQMARLMGVPGFSHQVAKSANTPSIVSGHSLHGTVAGMAIHEMLATSRLRLAGKEIAALQKYAVDFGDRRVFAGVHFPSDNIASWITALRIADECFADPLAARRFVEEAVGRSTVASAIAKYAQSHPASALAAGWELLRKEMGGTASGTRARASSRRGPGARRA